MKRIVLLNLVVLCSKFVLSQPDSVKNNVSLNKNIASQIKVIPSAKATIIRKDAINLKLQLSQFLDSISILKKDIDNAVDQMRSKADNVSEMSEAESLRLQMAMDRMSKMMSTLSNLLKKMSETSQSITQNIK